MHSGRSFDESWSHWLTTLHLRKISPNLSYCHWMSRGVFCRPVRSRSWSWMSEERLVNYETGDEVSATSSFMFAPFPLATEGSVGDKAASSAAWRTSLNGLGFVDLEVKGSDPMQGGNLKSMSVTKLQHLKDKLKHDMEKPKMAVIQSYLQNLS